jgi:hypothetical protein
MRTHLIYVYSVFFFFYSSCAHLEHRASMKCFVPLQFLNLRKSVGLLGRGISPSQGHYLKQRQNKHKQISMPWVGFEPTIPVFERAKRVDALDHAVTVMGIFCIILEIFSKVDFQLLFHDTGFEFFTAMKVNILVFLITSPCSMPSIKGSEEYFASTFV